jgi:TrmH family RNA methyltransferase
MGSLFSLPVVRHSAAEELVAPLRRSGMRLVAADPAAVDLWHSHPWEGGVGLVLGNEARGLSPELRPCVDAAVRLPMRGRAESLNVAVTGGILMYAWARANWARPS